MLSYVKYSEAKQSYIHTVRSKAELSKVKRSKARQSGVKQSYIQTERSKAELSIV